MGLPFVETAGCDSLRRPITLPPHRQRGHELVYLLRGRTTWMLPEAVMELSGGQCSLVQPGVEHRGEMEIIEPCTLIWLVFNLSRVDESFINNAERRTIEGILNKAGNIVFPATPSLKSALAVMYDALLSYGEGDGLSMLLFRSAVLSVLCRTAEALRARAKTLLRTERRITDVALELGFSSSQHFSSTFARMTGMAPTEYRLSAAVRTGDAREGRG